MFGGRSVELLIDQATMALTGQVKIYANLLCDFAVRYPAAFAVTAAPAGCRGFAESVKDGRIRLGARRGVFSNTIRTHGPQQGS